jgi:hypothetical protein
VPAHTSVIAATAAPTKWRNVSVTGLALASVPEIRIICTAFPPVLYPVRLPRLDRLLSAEGQLQPVLAKARDIRALAGLVTGFLSPDLARQARVANFREGQLVLLAGSTAVAAKLRLLAPSLSRFLTHQRWQVNSVSVRVQPTLSHIDAPQKVANFSTRTLDSLKKLHEEMSPSAARRALAELLARRGVTVDAKAPRRQKEAARKPARKPRT